MIEFILGLIIGLVFGMGGFLALDQWRTGLETIVQSKDVRRG